MSRVTLDLSNEKWQCEHIRPGQGVREEFHKIPCERQGAAFNWNYVIVPGDVYTDLQRVGEIEDPFFGQNMHKFKWVQEQEYWYMCKFNVPKSMQNKRIDLLFEGVDYSCSVWFNGYEMGSHEGMFSPFSFEIGDFVNFEEWSGGSNILLVKLDPPPRNYERVSGMKFNYNGDYHTGNVPFGIWRPVKLVAHEDIVIDTCRIESELSEKKATVSFETQINCLVAQSSKKTIRLTLEGANCDTQKIQKEQEYLIRSGENKVEFNITIDHPNLWWPWDLGEPNLHNVVIEVLDGERIVDSYKERFGIRTIEMAMNPGFTEEEAENPWTFVINGKKTYLRAACWGGQPSLLYGKNSKEKYTHLLTLVKKANINHLRIFGWHPPEVPDFYELCDELGITVWTNFTFSTNVIRKELPFADSMIKECIEIVKERRNHPSVIFWMGGEEVSFTDAHAVSGNKKLMAMIGEAVKRYTNTPYGLSSPLSNETGIKMGYRPKESQHANEHYYGAGHVFMEEYYPQLDCCIIPELTAASAPSAESLKKFIPEDELWPMGMSWAYHWADIDYLKILNVEVFDDDKMDSLETFVNATQEAHGRILQYALEHYRRRKPYNSGVALCHFITHWPDIKWGIVDYYGERKLCYDYVQKTYNPILVSLQFEKRRWENEQFIGKLWIINDYYKNYKDCKLMYTVKTDTGKTVKFDEISIDKIEENSSKEFIDIQCETPSGKTFTVEVALNDSNGKCLSDNTYELLIGNQEEAKKQCKKMRLEADERQAKYPGFYRYFPEKLDKFLY